MSAVLSISIALLLATIAGSLALLVRSGEMRAGLLAAMAALLATRQAVTLWGAWGMPLAFDAATGGELAGLAASALALLVLVAGWRTLNERDRAEALHWDSMEAVRALGELGARGDLELEERLPALLEIGCRCFGLEVGIVSRVTGDRYQVRAIRAPEGFPVRREEVLPLADTDCAGAVSSHRPIALARGAGGNRRANAHRGILPFEAYLGTAIRVGGEPVGTLCFGSREKRRLPFTATDKDLLRLMATWLASEIEHARPAPPRPETDERPAARLRAAPVAESPAVRRRGTVDLNQTVRRLDRKLRLRVGPEVELAVALAPDLRPAEVRHLPLEAIILSLVENAAEAMPEGGRVVLETENLEIAGAEPGGVRSEPHRYVTLSVTGTGAVIEADALSRIFEPSDGSRAPNGRPDPGRRLPLAAIYRILRRCGGDLSVEVEPGRGSTVTVFLAQPQATAGRERAVTADASTRAPRVLPPG